MFSIQKCLLDYLMLYQHQKLMNIFIITFSGKQDSIANIEIIDRAKDIKLKKNLHKIVYYSLNNWLFNRIY